MFFSGQNFTKPPSPNQSLSVLSLRCNSSFGKSDGDRDVNIPERNFRREIFVAADKFMI